MGKHSKKKISDARVQVAESKRQQGHNENQTLDKKKYEAELFNLQVELVKLQDWVKKTGARIVIVFEG
jgi:polyphosphate kinase 2 (PPK2 family)